MLKFKNAPFEEEIEKATNENNLTDDWSLIMLICDKAANFQDGSRFCFKAIMKRLYHPVPRVVLQTLTLLDACVKNCGRTFLLQVASSEFTNDVRKLLPKMHPSASDKLKELIQRWSLEEFKDDPELCIIPSLYYKLKSEGVEFPAYEKEKKKTAALCTNPDGVSSQEEENDIIKAIEISLKDTGRHEVPEEYRNVASSKPLPEPFKVRALYDFDAAEDNELTIKAGELVLVLDNSNSSWWKGSNHRGEGLFPSSFVTEDLDVKPEVQPEVSEQTVTKAVPEEELEIKLDEAKIEKLINWLNEIDPTEEMTDSQELLILEKQCYGMTPLIEENLQDIDNRMAKLNLVNEKIMSAFDLFHSFSDHASFNQPLQYYPGTLNQHVMSMPHPQMTMPHGMPLPQLVQPPVPQNMTAVPQQNIQMHSHPVTSVPGTITQAAQMPSNVTTNSVPQSCISDTSQLTNSTAPTTAPSSFSQASSQNLVGGYNMPAQAIPYPVQYGPNPMQPGYFPNITSVASAMPIPFAVPPAGPYYPMQYYYVNSNPTSHNAATTVTTSSQEPIKKAAIITENPATSVPLAVTYSNDLNNLYMNSTALKSNHAAVNTNTSAMGGLNGKNPSIEIKNDLLYKKNL